MGIYKRKDSPFWWMAFSVNGRMYRKSTETRNRKFAEAIYGKVLTKIVEGKWFDITPEKEYIFDEMMDRFMQEYAPKKEATTQKSYKSYLKHLTEHFSGFTLQEITPKMVSGYIEERLKEEVKPASVNRELAMLSKAFNLSIKEWGWTKENPCSKVSKLQENNKRTGWLTVDEEERLVRCSKGYLNGQLKEIITLALHTGMREGEILNLRWEDIDLVRKTIVVLKTKNKEERTIPINQTLEKMLREKSKVKNISGYIFVTANGEKIGFRNLLRSLSCVVKKARIENFTFHDLRHTFATRLVQGGVDIYSVAKLLGHKTLSVAQRYAHHSAESLRPYVMLMDKFYKSDC